MRNIGNVASRVGVISAARKGTISGIRIGIAGRAPVAFLAALALTGCATQTRYVTIGCLTQSQYDQLAAAKPGKVHSQLNGQADHDEKLIAGRLIRVEAWGDGELTILGGCITKDTH